jgi:hypothetical protein
LLQMIAMMADVFRGFEGLMAIEMVAIVAVLV